jgi:glycosyltransferase involved in cell wall biosynthesis
MLGLAPHVAGLGPDVCVVCANDSVADRFRERGVDTLVAPLRHKLDVRGATRLRHAVSRADVVHTQDRRAGLLIRPLARALDAVSVHTLHGVPHEIFGALGRDGMTSPPEVSRARWLWLRYGVLAIEASLARLGTTIVPSKAFRDILIEQRFPAARTVVIPNGVELRRLEPKQRHSPFRIATAGKVERWKGVDLLLQACATVTQPLRLDVFGDGRLRSALEREASRRRIPATFHGWVANIVDRLADVDLFVLPTRADNLPIAVLEAMSVALPTVASRVGGVPELILDGCTGLLVEPEDANALAAAIQRLASDEPLRLKLGRGAAALLAARFDIGVVARQTVELYERLTSRL